MKLKILDALLRLYEQNFRNLHWNSIGLEFNDSHKNITTEYYEMLSKSVDEVAEILCMYGVDPANYIEALDIIQSCEKKYLIVDSKTKYSKEEIVKSADIMLKDICQLFEELKCKAYEVQTNIKRTLGAGNYTDEDEEIELNIMLRKCDNAIKALSRSFFFVSWLKVDNHEEVD